MPTAVVTGSNSGIGHAFTQILVKEGYDVHAIDVQIGPTLQSLACTPHSVDLRSPKSIAAFAAQLQGQPVDVLLHVAGVMPSTEADGLTTVSKDSLTKTFETNTFGPLLLTQALLDNLLLATATAAPARVGIVSSRVGSMADNTSGGSYAYRASKAAVNSVGKSLAVDLKERGVVVSLLHPGIVKSNLDPGVAANPQAVEPELAAGQLWPLFKDKGLGDTGKFWHREGYELPW